MAGGPWLEAHSYQLQLSLASRGNISPIAWAANFSFITLGFTGHFQLIRQRVRPSQRLAVPTCVMKIASRQRRRTLWMPPVAKKGLSLGMRNLQSAEHTQESEMLRKPQVWAKSWCLAAYQPGPYTGTQGLSVPSCTQSSTQHLISFFLLCCRLPWLALTHLPGPRCSLLGHFRAAVSPRIPLQDLTFSWKMEKWPQVITWQQRGGRGSSLTHTLIFFFLQF